MKILAIESALGEFSAAFYDSDDRNGAARTAVTDPGAALEDGLGALARMISGLDPHTFDRIAVGIGPGSFMGARIAIGYAKALGLAWSLPVVGVSSFDILQRGAQVSGDHVAIVRGHRDVISARVRANGKEHRASGTVPSVAERLLLFLTKGCALVGDSAEDVLAAFGERAGNVRVYHQAIRPAALALVYAATEREPAQSLHEVRPDYGDIPPVRP